METKSQMINRIAELSQENAELKAYKDVNEDFKQAWEELKAENERLRDIIKSISKPVLLPDVPIEVTNKYKQTLQEIKTIAEENHFYFVEGAIISYETIKQLATNFEKILDLITKAEEE